MFFDGRERANTPCCKYEYNNDMVRMLSSTEWDHYSSRYLQNFTMTQYHLDTALRHLKSIDILCDITDMQRCANRINPTYASHAVLHYAPAPRPSVPQNVISMIERANAFDIVLYKTAKALLADDHETTLVNTPPTTED